MSDKIIENNQVTIMGEVVSGFTFSHEVFGEGFYMVDVSVKRLSNSRDLIPVMISERLIDVTQDYTGEFLMVTGQFRSYNRHEEQKTGWCCLCLPGRRNLLTKSRTGPRPTPSCWTGTYASCRSTVRRPWAGRSRTFCWR